MPTTPKPEGPTPALLPCPFCNSKAEIDFGDSGGGRTEEKDAKGYFVICNGANCPLRFGYQCDCDYGDSGYFKTREEAATAWNARPASTVNAAEEWIVRRTEGLSRSMFALYVGQSTQPLWKSKDEIALRRIAEAHNASASTVNAALREDSERLDWILENLELSDPHNSSTSFETREAIDAARCALNQQGI